MFKMFILTIKLKFLFSLVDTAHISDIVYHEYDDIYRIYEELYYKLDEILRKSGFWSHDKQVVYELFLTAKTTINNFADFVKLKENRGSEEAKELETTVKNTLRCLNKIASSNLSKFYYRNILEIKTINSVVKKIADARENSISKT